MCEPEDLITSNAQSEWRETTQNLVECSPLMLSDLSKLDTVGGVAIKVGVFKSYQLFLGRAC